MKIKSGFILGSILCLLTACAPSVAMLDSKGTKIPRINYNYLNSLKAVECSDMYMKSEKRKGWMIHHLQNDTDFLTARGMSNSEAEALLQKRMRSLLESYKIKGNKYYPGMKLMISSHFKISQPYLDSITGGLPFDNLYKTTSYTIGSGANDLTFSNEKRLLDDVAPRYSTGNITTIVPGYEHFQKFSWSVPSELLKNGVLKEYNRRIYLKLPKNILREKIKLLVGFRKPSLSFTAKQVLMFGSCNDDGPYMKVMSFQLTDDATGEILVDWKK